MLEGLTEKILVKLFAHPELFAETAFIVTFDEGGGYWNCGFFQPVNSSVTRTAYLGSIRRVPLLQGW